MKLKVAIAFLMYFFIYNSANAQWTQAEEPTGGMCRSFARVGNEIWAGYNYGVYVSTNEGATWRHHPTIYAPVLEIRAIGDTIILLISNFDLSILASYDGGITWNAPGSIEAGNYYLSGTRDLIILDSAIVVNSNYSDYYVSFDLAQTWGVLNIPAPYSDVMTWSDKFLIFHETSPPYTKYYSANGGITWNYLDSTFGSNYGLVIDSTLYFSTFFTDTVMHSCIMRSANFGQTWDTLAFDLFAFPGRLEYVNNKIYYTDVIAPQTNQYESVDGGTSWSLSSLPPELYSIGKERSVQLYSGEWLFNLGVTGLNRYNFYSGLFYQTQTGIKARGISFLQENKGALFAVADGYLYSSYDAGTTWNEAPSFIYGFGDFVFKGDTIFAVSSPHRTALCYSYDNGHTWDSLPSQAGCWQNPEFMKELNGKLYVSGNNGTAVSNDWGANWNCISTVDSICSGSVQGGGQMVVCNNELFVLDVSDRQISKFDTVTQTWLKKFCISMPGTLYSMLASSGDKLAFCGGGQFYISADAGNTWYSPARNGFPSGAIPTSLSYINGAWFSPCNGGIYYSYDDGENWMPLLTNSAMVTSQNCRGLVTILNDILYAGGNNVWKSNDTLALITGNVYFDNNNNGIKDGNETGIPQMIMHTTPNNLAFNTDLSGNYIFFTAANGDILKPEPQTDFCSSSPPSYITNGAASNVDFGVYFYPGVQDLVVDITNRTPFRPGFSSIIEVMVKSNGTVAIPGMLQVILDSNVSYISASVNPDQVNGDTLIFTIDTLDLFEKATITIETETYATVPLSSPVLCSAQISPLAGDTFPADNHSQIVSTVVGSCDPNDKTAACGPYFTPTQLQNGDEMIYTIRFQNTGNFQADNIHIIDTLSQFFVLKDFRIISSSHLVHYTMEGNGIVTFYFDNIFLPPITTDEPGSHGFVKYALKCNPNLTIGDAIDNTAYIYFDFNAPVQTNTETIIIADPPLNANTTEVPEALRMTIYPNPATNTLNGIFNSGKSKSFTLTVLSQIGQSVKTTSYSGDRFSTEINDLPAGLYYGKIIIQGSGESLFFRFIVVK